MQEQVVWRSDDNIPPASRLISSPYDPDAHMSIKRSTVWTGYKVHLTETCDEDLPHLLIHVETTPATTQDMEMTGTSHQALAEKHLLPAEQVMDTGYVDGDHIVTSQHTYGVELLGRSPAAPVGKRMQVKALITRGLPSIGRPSKRPVPKERSVASGRSSRIEPSPR